MRKPVKLSSAQESLLREVVAGKRSVAAPWVAPRKKLVELGFLSANESDFRVTATMSGRAWVAAADGREVE